MTRLTTKNELDKVSVSCSGEELLNKLYAYEDTGLEPSEVDGLKRRIKVLERALELACVMYSSNFNYCTDIIKVNNCIKRAEKELANDK